jgi:hypothetical protein
MITSNILNIDNKPYTDTVFHIVIGYHRSIDAVVFADNLQEALDIIIDYYDERKSDYAGFFFCDDELVGEEEELGYLSGGNCGKYITFTADEMRVEECSTDGIELYIDLETFKGHN